jgi:hypothetical protein
MNDLLILPAAQLPRLSFTETAIVRREAALAASALVGQVRDSGQQDQAVLAQRQLAELQREIEAARKQVKGPVLDLGREIDRVASEFLADVVDEVTRISAALGDYQALEMKRQQAAERAARLEAERIERERREQEERVAEQIERERQAALAAAKSHEEIDRIEREAADRQRDEQERLEREARLQQLAALSTIKQPDRAEGQSVRQDWDFEVVDVWALARMHPGCVEVKPRRREIIDLLRTGNTLAGIRAFQVVKSTTRTTKRQEVEV